MQYSHQVQRDPTIALAAQADLIFLTAEMLRSPQTIAKSHVQPWYDSPWEALHSLIETGFYDLRPKMDGNTASTLSQALMEVYHLAKELVHDDWSDEYWRLFDCSQACPLNQASYIRRDKGTILGDLCGFYKAFGWKGNLDSGERPDHLLCQLEFTGMLLAMAAQSKHGEQRQVVLEACSQYARLHMHDWLPSVCFRLIETTQLTYFGAVSQWLLLLWNQLTSTHQWPSDVLTTAPLTPLSDPEDPYECAAPDLVQLQQKAEAIAQSV
jgi:nitrate reductase assembly molybdenum cofactor insertion protein NarJ